MLSLAVLASLVGACAATSVAPSPEARGALVPSGKLRVGINLGNPVLARRDPAKDDLAGITVDLGRMLAERLGAEFVPVPYANAGALVEGARRGEWDIGFAAIDPSRAEVLEFTPPYMEVSNTYLVPVASRIRLVADADRPGVRIGVGSRNAADLHLSRSLKHAQLVRIPDSVDAAVELMQSGRADAYAGNRERLLLIQERLGGFRLLDERFHAIEHAIALPRGRGPGLAYVKVFVEELKANGSVAQAVVRHSIRGVDVAPPDLP